MLRGDLDQNPLQMYGESFKDALKKTMLDQELVFRRQIYELHRLYRVQKTLMEGCKLKGMDSYSLRDTGTATVTPATSYGVHERPSFLTQRPIDLQLSADEFISLDKDVTPINSIIIKNSFGGENESSMVDVNLSLNIKENDHTSCIWKKASTSFCNDKRKLEFTCGSSSSHQSRNKDPISGIASSISVEDAHLSVGRQPSFSSGYMGHHIELPSPDVLNKNQQPSLSRKMHLLDLNTPQTEEESSYLSNNSATTPNPSWSSSKKLINTSIENSDTCLRSKDKARDKWTNVADSRDANFSKINCIILESDSAQELCNSSLIISQGQISVAEKNYNEFSNTCKSDCIPFDRSNSIKTVQSGVGGRDSNVSTSNETPKAQFSESPDGIEQVVEEPIQIAAQLLVNISLENQTKRVLNEEEDKPQRSLDSFELTVLKETEISPNEYCISSDAFLVDESNKKEARYKLKRGTRMKDFRKDILPGLSTLTRHEIREDISILEGVIRSREYRKMRAGMVDGGGWCKPVRSKRSRGKSSRRYCV